MRDFRDAKAMARDLRQALAAKGLKVSLAEALELVARLLGARDWNTLAAAIQAASKPAAPAPQPAPAPSPPTAPKPFDAPRRPGSIRFAPALEATLHRATRLAAARKHEYTTLEHLLVALTDDRDALAVLEACAVDAPELASALTAWIDAALTSLVLKEAEDPKPTAGFHRVIQRAVIHVQSAGRDEVSGANVLTAIFSERESRAYALLTEREMTRFDAVNFIANGVRKDGRGRKLPDRPAQAPPEPTRRRSVLAPGLEATLQRAADLAAARKHQATTLEHLLLALIDDPDALLVLDACQVDVAALGWALTKHVDVELRGLTRENGEAPKPTAGFDRVVERAVIHVQSSGRDEVTGANVLVAIFSERESRACALLAAQKLTRDDAVNFIAHGVRKDGKAA
jgi:ATP-dependent Clp protease ATP-binding subunit ClpA